MFEEMRVLVASVFALVHFMHACMQLIAARVRSLRMHTFACTHARTSACLHTGRTDKLADRQTDRQSVSRSACQRQTQRDTDTQTVDNVHILCRILNMYEYVYFYLCLLLILLLLLEGVRYTE